MSKNDFLWNSVSFPRNLYDELTKQKECKQIITRLTKSDVKPLNADIKKKINQYARDVLGNRKFSTWLYVYTIVRGSFFEGWIPEDYFIKILPRINGVYNTICGAKSLTKRILHTDDIPDKAYYINGIWFDLQGNRIQSNEVKSFIFDQSATAYVKLESTGKGTGIMVIDRDTFNETVLKNLDKNFVVQKTIIQAKWFEDISPGCVATLRILTGLPVGGLPDICAAYLRIGIKGAKYVASAKALKIPIFDNEGSLGNHAFDSNWMRYNSHPDTGVKFEGKKVPSFVKAVTLCKKLHERVPQFTIIGWDVAITEDGKIELMEWNVGYPDIKFSEATIGPCFKHLHLERFA